MGFYRNVESIHECIEVMSSNTYYGIPIKNFIDNNICNYSFYNTKTGEIGFKLLVLLQIFGVSSFMNDNQYYPVNLRIIAPISPIKKSLFATKGSIISINKHSTDVSVTRKIPQSFEDIKLVTEDKNYSYCDNNELGHIFDIVNMIVFYNLNIMEKYNLLEKKQKNCNIIEYIPTQVIYNALKRIYYGKTK